MRQRPVRTVFATVLAALMLATVSPMASAASTKFGAKLNGAVQPDGGKRTCPGGSTTRCTWIMGEAYQRPDVLKAPKGGTLVKIRVIAGSSGGSFKPVLARIRGNGDELEARVVRRGSTINYVKQPDPDPPYQVQTFTVNMTVNKGDVLGIEAHSMSLINCSGAFLPRFKPALQPGGPFVGGGDNEGCFLLVEGVIA